MESTRAMIRQVLVLKAAPPGKLLLPRHLHHHLLLLLILDDVNWQVVNCELQQFVFLVVTS